MSGETALQKTSVERFTPAANRCAPERAIGQRK
jgi:hypothetical protein